MYAWCMERVGLTSPKIASTRTAARRTDRATPPPLPSLTSTSLSTYVASKRRRLTGQKARLPSASRLSLCTVQWSWAHRPSSRRPVAEAGSVERRRSETASDEKERSFTRRRTETGGGSHHGGCGLWVVGCGCFFGVFFGIFGGFFCFFFWGGSDLTPLPS